MQPRGLWVAIALALLLIPSIVAQTETVYIGWDNNGNSDPDCWAISGTGVTTCGSPLIPIGVGGLNPNTQQECVNQAAALFNTQTINGVIGGWSVQSWLDTGVASSCVDSTSDRLEVILQRSSIGTPEIRVCINSCGNGYNYPVGGYLDTQEWTDHTYDTGCTGTVQNRGDNGDPTLICSTVPPDQARIKLCQTSCGGTHPFEIGGWLDTSSVADVAFDPGCTGSLQNPYSTNLPNTKICSKQDYTGDFKACQSSCNSGFTSVGGWIIPQGTGLMSNLGSGCQGGPLLPPFSTTSTRILCQGPYSGSTTQCSSTNPCSNGETCQNGACIPSSGEDADQQLCESQGYMYLEAAAPNRCCGDDGLQDIGPIGPLLCANIGGTLSTQSIQGGIWMWVDANQNHGSIVRDFPTETAYVANADVWQTCSVFSQTPNPISGQNGVHEYLCFDPLAQGATVFETKLLARIDWTGCGPLASTGACNSYTNFNQPDRLYFFDRNNNELTGGIAELPGNQYSIGASFSIPVYQGEKLRYYGEQRTGLQQGTAAITLIYRPTGGQPQTISYSAVNYGAEFNFTQDGSLEFPAGTYNAHVLLFLDAIQTGSSQNLIAECCGDLNNCNAPLNAQGSPNYGGQGSRRATGEGVISNSVGYFCAPNGNWIQDLDTVNVQGDPNGLTCTNAVSPAGQILNYEWTGTACCGDDQGQLDTYIEQNNPSIGCYDGYVANDCFNAAGPNNEAVLQNGAFTLCPTGVSPCGSTCGFTFYCDPANGWQQTTPNVTHTYSVAPGQGGASCCSNGGCFNGSSCVANQGNNPSSQPILGNLRCVGGQWTSGQLRRTPYGQTGFCGGQSECLFSTDVGGAQQVNLNNILVNNVNCVQDGDFVNDNFCTSGLWSSRTRNVMMNMMQLVGSNEDFISYCDKYSNVLNDIYYTVEGYGSVAQVFEPDTIANNVCLLKKGQDLYFGTSLNQPVGTMPGSILPVFGYQSDYCDSISYSPWPMCSNDPTVFYDQSQALFIVSLGTPLVFSTQPPSSLIQSTLDPTPYLGVTFGSADLQLATDATRFDRIFAARSGQAWITGRVDERWYSGTEFVHLNYGGIMGVCSFLDALNANQQGNIGFNVVYCNENAASGSYTAVLSRDVNPFLNVDWEVGQIWQPLASMIRLGGS